MFEEEVMTYTIMHLEHRTTKSRLRGSSHLGKQQAPLIYILLPQRKL